LIIVVWRNWPDKDHFGWTILQHKLLWMRVDNCLWFFTIALLFFFPNSKLLTLLSNFAELIIYICIVICWSTFYWLFATHRLGFVFCWCRLHVDILLQEAVVRGSKNLLLKKWMCVILKSASSASVAFKLMFMKELLLFEILIVDSSEIGVL
jgi:hypothetical protein